MIQIIHIIILWFEILFSMIILVITGTVSALIWLFCAGTMFGYKIYEMDEKINKKATNEQG